MRKTKEVVIPDEPRFDRDRNKCFWVIEMPARQAEQWAHRAFLALAHSAIDIPEGLDGMEGIYQMALLLRHVQFPELGPLMDELFSCVSVFSPEVKRDGEGVPMIMRKLNDPMDGMNADIEEVATRQLLRSEVLALHINFSLAATALNMIAVASEMSPSAISNSTQTSRKPLARSSRRKRQPSKN